METIELQPHQQRVVAERDELNEKLSKLGAFLDGPQVVEPAEFRRLQLQRTIMSAYLAVLDERILNFK